VMPLPACSSLAFPFRLPYAQPPPLFRTVPALTLGQLEKLGARL
jgi:hypothetical protein